MRALALMLCAYFGLAQPALAADCTPARYDTEKTRVSLWFGMKAVKNDQGGAKLSLQVADDFWAGMNLDSRREFFDAISCAVSGPGKGLAYLRLVSMQTGVELAEMKMGKIEFRK